VSDDRTARPITFLVSTTGGSRAAEVLEAVAPALERVGAWRQVAHPESSLAYAAARVAENGGRPIHVAIGPAHEVYLTPALPNMLLPLWDYPEVPAIEMNRNSRMNWARVVERADVILAPSEFTIEALRRSGVSAPAVVAPIPPGEGWGDVPTWGPHLPVSAYLPHVVWCGAQDTAEARASKAARRIVATAETWSHPMPPLQPPLPFKARAKRAAKRRLRRLKPYFSNAAIERIDAYKARVMPLVRRPNPVRIVTGAARIGYRHMIRRWIGESAHAKLRGLADRLRGQRLAPAPHHVHTHATLGASLLTISGLAYSTTIDYADPTADDVSVISAFLHAFADRPDATLIVRLATTPEREAHDLGRLSNAVHAPRIEARCRVVAVPGRLGVDEELALARMASYHVETSRTRGLPVALMQALAAGRPAIVPRHSAYRDWVDDAAGLLVASNPEPTSWPMDGLGKHVTTWNRVVWSDLREKFVESARIADDDPVAYERFSAEARDHMARRASVAALAATLGAALELLPSRALGAFAWA
jgi:glycosyltransferase involved in cell wall biosynthesis